jgi:hypothetical protein
MCEREQKIAAAKDAFFKAARKYVEAWARSDNTVPAHNAMVDARNALVDAEKPEPRYQVWGGSICDTRHSCVPTVMKSEEICALLNAAERGDA